MEESGDDRRRFLAKAAVAGAAAWVAPLVISQPAGAATSQSTPPTEPCVPCNSANVVNPSFEDGLTGWTPTATVLVVDYDAFGASGPSGAGPNLALLGPATPDVSHLSQSLPIDDACHGLPFTLSFFAFGLAAGRGEVYVQSVQFTNSAGNDGDPFTVTVPARTPDADGIATLDPAAIIGTVPVDATGVTITFSASASDLSGLLIDLVDLTICG